MFTSIVKSKTNSFLLNKQVGSSSESYKESTSVREVKKREYRRCDDSHLEFRFISIKVNKEERRQYVLCLVSLSSERTEVILNPK